MSLENGPQRLAGLVERIMIDKSITSALRQDIMARFDFIAYGLNSEIDLSKLATALGINRKYRWEEPMGLVPDSLSPLSTQRNESEQVYLFYFGGAVFVNCQKDTIDAFFKKMTGFSEAFRDYPAIKYVDHYSLQSSEVKINITNDFAVMPVFDPSFIDIISFVISKSVGLERIEDQVDTVLDEMEDMIGLLAKGKLGIPDHKLAKMASTILNFKYRSIAHIMVLDKPDITWDNLEADRLYLTMANLFELDQRYQEIKHKSETLMDITEVFSGLSHSRRATRLEWTIIILIVIEILIYIFEIIRSP